MASSFATHAVYCLYDAVHLYWSFCRVFFFVKCFCVLFFLIATPCFFCIVLCHFICWFWCHFLLILFCFVFVYKPFLLFLFLFLLLLLSPCVILVFIYFQISLHCPAFLRAPLELTPAPLELWATAVLFGSVAEDTILRALDVLLLEKTLVVCGRDLGMVRTGRVFVFFLAICDFIIIFCVYSFFLSF